MKTIKKCERSQVQKFRVQRFWAPKFAVPSVAVRSLLPEAREPYCNILKSYYSHIFSIMPWHGHGAAGQYSVIISYQRSIV